MVNYLTTLRGTIGLGEEFSHTLAVSADIVPDPAGVAQAVNQAWALAWAQNIAGFRASFSSFVSYTDASAAVILNATTGELGAAVHAAFDPTPLQGTGAAAAFQVATAVSLTAGTRPNGQPLRGRFYLPTISSTAVSGGTLPSLTVQGIADSIGFFLGELEQNEVQPCVWSRTLGALQAVTAARVGNVPDTIRSRRNQLVEVYSPINITPVP